MEQRVLAERSERVDGPSHKTGWMDAHVRVQNAYPLVSVRSSRLDSSGRCSADWAEEAIVPVSAHAAVLVRAIATEGKCPHRVLVEAVVDQSRAGSGATVELQVWVDGSGLAEIHLQGIAMAVVQDRTASGELGLAGQTTVVARLFGSSAAGAEADIAQQPVRHSARPPGVGDQGGSMFNEPGPVDGFGLSTRLPGDSKQIAATRAFRLSWPVMGKSLRLSPPHLPGRSGVSRARLGSGLKEEPRRTLTEAPLQLHLPRPSVRLRRPHLGLQLPQPPLHGSRRVLASGALAALAILVVVLATLRTVPGELFILTAELPAAQIPVARTDTSAPKSDGTGQSTAAVAVPGVALGGGEMAAREVGGDQALAVVPATGDAANSATSVAVEGSTVGAQPPDALIAIPVTGSEAATPAATPLALIADRAVGLTQGGPATPLSAAPTPLQVELLAAPRTLIDFSVPAALNPDWPNDPGSTAWFAPDGYHLAARRQGQFVAVGLTPDRHLRDVVLTATFHKTGGPTGGGYGLILRDQGPHPLDGLNQQGKYVVVEIGDRGDVGMWRRDDDQWIELLPWTASASVRPLNAENVIAFKVFGDQLTLSVNGSEVATRTDATLVDGGAGVFVGGDDNQAVLTKLTLETIE